METRHNVDSAVVIRRATEADAHAIIELTLSGFRDGPYGHIPATEERLALVHDVGGRAAAGELLVADVDSVIVGTANLLRAGTAYGRQARPGEAELRLLTVASSARGRGIAEALVNASIESALEWGIDQLVLDTGSENVASQRLYDRVGFVRAESREQEEPIVGNGDIRSFVYTKQIQPSADVLIRLAEPGEYDRVADVSDRAYSSDYDVSAGYRESLRAVAGRAEAHQVWVAADRSGGEILATVATPRRGRTISDLARAGELDFRLLAVDPDARGRGLGILLTRHVIELGRLRRVDSVVMNSGENMLGAHALYRKLGFERLEEREIDILDGDRPLHLLAFGYRLTDA